MYSLLVSRSMSRLRGYVQLLAFSCRTTSASSLQHGQYFTTRRAFTTSSLQMCAGKDIKHSLDDVHTNEFSPRKDLYAESDLIKQVNMPDVDTTVIPTPLGIQVFPEIFDRLPPKCPGCGSLFQSETPDEPGYIRSEKAPGPQKVSESKDQIPNDKPLICQRCFSLQHYNTAAPVNVNNSHITELLSHIARRKALIVYVVDIMDLPGSIFPHLLEIVGPTKRILIVANKVDMLPQDGRPSFQEERLKSQVLRLCTEHGLEGGSLKDVCLVSAKYGFGIPQLVKKLQHHWEQTGDVYMIGCSNTGKTTLYNTLLDLLNVHKKKGDMLQRATVSKWPGTTLSLMRFPLGHWMLSKLLYRLNNGIPKDGKFDDEDEVTMDTEIIDNQETTYKDSSQLNAGPTVDIANTGINQQTYVQPYKPEFVTMETERNQHWFYDTPGIISENQITSFLTMEELKVLHPSRWIVPRTFLLKPSQTLLLGGLGRVDFVQISRKPLQGHGDTDSTDTLTKANRFIYFTVFASNNLPIHVLNTLRAEDYLHRHAGTEVLMVPSGDEKRMALFPELQSLDLSLVGIGWDESAADVMLSNVGWVAITAGRGSDVLLKAHTPDGRGLGLREPALLPTSVTQRGKRGVPHLGYINTSAYAAHRKKSPHLIKSLGHDQRGVHWWMRESERVKKRQLTLVKEQRMGRIMEKSLGYTPVKRLPLQSLQDTDEELAETEEIQS